MIEHVIGIDPGLDGAGIAWLTKAGASVSVREVRTIRTSPKDSMAFRLHALGTDVAAQLASWCRVIDEQYGAGARDTVTVTLEVPTHVGRSDHARKQGSENVNARSMAAFWQSIGVIRAAIVAAKVALVEAPPGGAKKEYRQQLYIRWTHAGKNADERDAIVTACTQLFSTAPIAAIATLSARP